MTSEERIQLFAEELKAERDKWERNNALREVIHEVDLRLARAGVRQNVERAELSLAKTLRWMTPIMAASMAYVAYDSMPNAFQTTLAYVLAGMMATLGIVSAKRVPGLAKKYEDTSMEVRAAMDEKHQLQQLLEP